MLRVTLIVDVEEMGSKVTETVKTVAIDVDSVLADVMLVWTDEYNKRNKAQITKKEIANWDIPTVLPITPPQILQVLHLCMEVPLARNTTYRTQDW